MGQTVELEVRSGRKIERRDVTPEVTRALEELGIVSGAVLVSVPHTTAALSVGENWDPDVGTDLERAFAAWVSAVTFQHGEGNSAAHFLSEAIGNSRLMPVSCGKLVLGRWQGIFLIELDGPRQRTIRIDAIRASP